MSYSLASLKLLTTTPEGCCYLNAVLASLTGPWKLQHDSDRQWSLYDAKERRRVCQFGCMPEAKAPEDFDQPPAFTDSLDEVLKLERSVGDKSWEYALYAEQLRGIGLAWSTTTPTLLVVALILVLHPKISDELADGA